MRKIVLAILAVFIALSAVLSISAFSSSAYAASCNGVETSLIECEDDGKAGSGIFQILKKVLDIMTALIGVAATIGIAVAGIQYLTAGDNEGQVAKAKRRIFELVLGLVVYVLFYAFLGWLLPNVFDEPELPDIPPQSEQSSGNGSGGNNSGNGQNTNTWQPTVHYEKKHQLLEYGSMKYWLNVPENATDGMPLVIFLHGSYEVGKPYEVENLPQAKYMENYSGSTPFISIVPVATANAWVPSTVKGLVDKVATEYKSNPNKIYIWGFSLGGVGTWATVNNYPDYFAAAIPISGCPYNVSATNFTQVKLRAISGDTGDETGRAACMRNFVNEINASGGSATMETASGQTHSTISRALNYDELFNWMLGIGQEMSVSGDNSSQNQDTGAENGSSNNLSGAQRITQTAFRYAWPAGDSHNYWTSPRNDSLVKVPNEAYKAALLKWITVGGGYSTPISASVVERNDTIWGQGASCDVFVGTVVRSVTGDTNFPFRGPGIQRRYAREHPELYEEIDYKNSVANLQPGDLMFSTDEEGIYGHAQIFCGTTNTGKPMICEAAYEIHTALVNDVAPNISGFAVFRYKGK